jgi:hypothetical protein
LGQFRSATPEEFAALRHELIVSHPRDNLNGTEWLVARVSTGKDRLGANGFCAKIRIPIKTGGLSEPRVAYGFLEAYDPAKGTGPTVTDLSVDLRGNHTTHDELCDEWNAW